MLPGYSETYMEIFRAALSAAVIAAEQLSDDELAQLARYSGIVGLAAKQVKASRDGAQ